MKLVLLSDIHLLWDKPRARLDDAKETQLRKFQFVLDWAQERKAVILQAGDVFDSARSYRVLQGAIDLFFHSHFRGFYCVYGQHDTYLYNEAARNHTSLGVMIAAGFMNMLVSPSILVDDKEEFIAIWGCSYGQSLPDKACLDSVKIRPWNALRRILVIHQMISAGQMWAGQQGCTYAQDFLKKHKEYDLILCADAHQKFLFRDGKRIICNAGPLLRREATPEMLEHHPGFWVYETVTQEIDWVEIRHEPSDKVLSREHIEDKVETSVMLQEFIDAIKTGAQKGLSLRDNLWLLMDQNDIGTEVRALLSEITGGEV